MKKESLLTGINLGGWISQYPAYDHDHFKSFIIAPDLDRIAGWGFDHIRLPVDYPVLEDDSQPGELLSSGLEYIGNCLEWCGRNGLRAILDLHKAPGFAFDEHETATLFSNPVLEERFIHLWQSIAHQFAGKSTDNLAFELLNEIALPDSSPWNNLVQRTVSAIRRIDPERLIIVGGNYYNSADELRNIERPDDDNILYTFHFYLPLTVTHQNAPWVQPLVEYGRTLDYPGQQADGLEAIIARHSYWHLSDEVDVRFDRNYLKKKLAPAVVFAREAGQPVYCGEFGVYEKAPMSARLNWTRDVVELLNEHRIGHAIWTYKALDFGLVDRDGRVVNDELLKIAIMR